MATFETKFDLGQTVHVFAREKRQIHDPCPVCAGTGRVRILAADGSDAGEATCRNEGCRYGQIRETWFDVWEYAGSARVGSIRVVAYDADLAPSFLSEAYEEWYMLDKTGIGSGTVYVFTPDGGWSHAPLFATRAEGEKWAARTNEPLRAEAGAKRERMREAEASPAS